MRPAAPTRQIGVATPKFQSDQLLTKAKTILSDAVVIGLLGGAVPARASDHSGQDKTYGGPVQTWCAINSGCNGGNKLAASSSPKRQAPHQHGHEASAR